MRRLLVATAVVTLLAGPAYSQALGTGIPLNQEKEVSPETRAKRQATEDAYKSTMKGIPDAKQPDPWGNMRDTSGGNAAKARPAAKKSSGNLAN